MFSFVLYLSRLAHLTVLLSVPLFVVSLNLFGQLGHFFQKCGDL